MAVTSTAPRRRGPRPKGNREQFTIRVPADHLAHYRTQAEAAGIPVGDYLALQLAERHGLDEPGYLHRDSDQSAIDYGDAISA